MVLPADRPTPAIVEISTSLDQYAHESEIAEGLNTIARLQKLGASYSAANHREGYTPEDFRSAALGAFVELGELVNECQWKPWREYNPPTDAERQKVREEFADVLHFIAWMMNNLEDRFGLTPSDFAETFMAVHERNIARFSGQVPGHEPPR